jgi:hypothetical protein
LFPCWVCGESEGEPVLGPRGELEPFPAAGSDGAVYPEGENEKYEYRANNIKRPVL